MKLNFLVEQGGDLDTRGSVGAIRITPGVVIEQESLYIGREIWFLDVFRDLRDIAAVV